jgi:Ca2+-binding RTX toxin-like protein/subtilisin-like proprotein convertase family protein
MDDPEPGLEEPAPDGGADDRARGLRATQQTASSTATEAAVIGGAETATPATATATTQTQSAGKLTNPAPTAGPMHMPPPSLPAEAAAPDAAPAMPARPEAAAAESLIELHYMPSDTLFGEQWHLFNNGQNGGTPGVDINVTPVWDEFTGAGVTVGVWDDGVQSTHHDLDDNYDSSLHIPDSGGTHDPDPQDPASAHGTAVAGLIAAENNGTGTVGVAFDASIAGVDMFFDPDLVLEDSMQHLDTYDITNHSWGFTSPFAANILSPDPFWSDFFAGLIDSTVSGRGGLGTINFVSNGNSRTATRDGNDSNFTGMPQTIAVGAVDHSGFVSWYSTPGANLLVGTTSNGLSGIWTTDRTGADGYSDGSNQAPNNPDPDYTDDFGGTSSAAPITAGIAALMLEANPDLGWRDVQTILANTARHTGTDVGNAPQFNELYEWSFNGASHWNGGGMHFSNDYGFGLPDALAAVRLAETWTQQNTNGNWSTPIADTWAGSEVILDDGAPGNAVTVTLTSTDLVALETVGLRLDFGNNNYTGDYLITLTSPDGTTTTLSRPFNGGASATDSWVFSSNEFRGESSTGTWTVSIDDQWTSFEGTLTGAELYFYGGAATLDDTYIFTNEYSDYAGGAFGHTVGVTDTNGGIDTMNLAAVTAASMIYLDPGMGMTGSIDGVSIAPGQIAGIENVIAGDGNDSLIGNAAENDLQGWRGDDTLGGGDGDDLLNGGAGTDFVGGGAGDDTLQALLGNDTLNGEDGQDALFGGDGNNQLVGGNGNDTAFGYAGSDIMLGGAGFDQLNGGGQNDELRGGDQADTLDGSFGNDLVLGQQGNDVLIGGNGNDTMDGGLDRDDLSGGIGADSLRGFNGADSLEGDGGNDTVLGQQGNDLIGGGDGADSLNGGGDQDTLFGGNGDDRLDGSFGFDSMDGGFGNDTMLGGTANDTVLGNGGNDSMEGGFGFDSMDGGGGNDTLFGDQQGDTLLGNVGDDHLDGGVGNDSLDGQGDDDTLLGGGNQDTLRGNFGNDSLDGGADRDLLDGGANNDILLGGAGFDTLLGRNGDDTLDGGTGDDALTGGNQADTFVFGLNYDEDRVLDYVDADDVLQLDDTLWGGGLTAQQVVDTYANVFFGDTIFNFGGGDVFLIDGVANEQTLVDNITIV